MYRARNERQEVVALKEVLVLGPDHAKKLHAEGEMHKLIRTYTNIVRLILVLVLVLV